MTLADGALNAAGGLTDVGFRTEHVQGQHG